MRQLFTYLLAGSLLLLGDVTAIPSAAPPQQSVPAWRQKFAKAQEGDFVVTAQASHYSLLFIRSLKEHTLSLEEISIPSNQIDLKKIDWKKWVAAKAPGHTSWTLYEIDRITGKLVTCFSFSRNGWLHLDNSEQFLARLLTLPLTPVPLSERKRIGPQPSTGEEDRRAFWTPPLTINGKKISKPSFDVLKAKWPADGSRLSLCQFEFYFSKEEPTFPFPYWLEVHSPHYAFKMRTIDSGYELSSPMQLPIARSKQRDEPNRRERS
jgi:hypothetical protein